MEKIMTVNQILNINCLDGLKSLPDASVDCCVTSPPYYGLRDYGHEDQLGTEATPEEYVEKLTAIFAEVMRVLKPHGTLWLNLGDTYNSPSSNQNGRSELGSTINPVKYYTNGDKSVGRKKTLKQLKQKDLIGIPWMVAFSLRSAGWYLRQDIIWNKPNPMPESVTDRCTKSHEYIFLLSKSAKYYFDAAAIKTPIKDESVARMLRGVSDTHKNVNGAPGQTPHSMLKPRKNHKNMQREDKVHSFHVSRKGSGIDNSAAINGSGLKGHSGNFDDKGNLIGDGFANKKSVWTVTTKPFAGAHFATFPEQLIVDMIKAGCKPGGIVLDPFMGAGTTALVARKLTRNFIGFELNPQYIQIAEKRLSDELGMFL
jgi:DNA modification methylase